MVEEERKPAQTLTPNTTRPTLLQNLSRFSDTHGQPKGKKGEEEEKKRKKTKHFNNNNDDERTKKLLRLSMERKKAEKKAYTSAEPKKQQQQQKCTKKKRIKKFGNLLSTKQRQSFKVLPLKVVIPGEIAGGGSFKLHCIILFAVLL